MTAENQPRSAKRGAVREEAAAREIKVRLSEGVAAGTYANSMMVQHTREEFIMDFALIAGGSGVVVARIVVGPGHMKRVVAAMQENIAKYESAFGQVSPAAEPSIRIGFQPPVD